MWKTRRSRRAVTVYEHVWTVAHLEVGMWMVTSR